MYKDNSCSISSQPSTSTNVAEAATNETAVDQQEEREYQQQQQPQQFNTVKGDVGEDDFSCPSETGSDSECEYRSSRPSTASTTSLSSSSTTVSAVVSAVNPRSLAHNHSLIQRSHSHGNNSDISLLRKIGYIVSRVRCLAKIYGDFKLINPYSPVRQKCILQDIFRKHSAQDLGHDNIAITISTTNTKSSSISITSATSGATTSGSLASNYNYQSHAEQSSFQDESLIGTVRRKSSATLTPTPSITLLEDLLVQLYESRRNKVTVIRRRYNHRNSISTIQSAPNRSIPRNFLIIMTNKTASNSVERLLQLENEDESGNGIGGPGTSNRYLINAVTSCHLQQQQCQQQRGACSFLQPVLVNNKLRHRRASDCSTHASAQQSQITLNNNNLAKLPVHRGSCGAAGEHLIAAHSIADRQNLLLSKSCSNVGNGLNLNNGAFLPSSDFRTVAQGATTTVGRIHGSSSIANGTGVINMTTGGSAGSGGAGGIHASSNNNGNNEYSIVQLNNTIIKCHFTDDDFRALVKDLKRKVEYTERMNWLCLSKRPLGPPHRKSSLPKHQDVKKRFLEICDTTLSEELRNALRLPAFDSYEWSDADIIHLMQTMFVDLNFIEKFNIPIDILREWLYEVYKHYNEVPFHNFRHCFCVAQMMYAITKRANLLQRLGHLECLILLVSCICHDLDHPGYNNVYQINARTELALRYNDISPLENHHCSIAFRLLEHPDCNIFRNFNRETFNQIREGIIRCILATDMARHNEILTQFKEITSSFDYTNRAHINLLCMILIKVADISNESRPMDVAEPWLDRLLQEFFAQSAAEKSEGLPVTPFMDPDKISRTGSQVRFIGLVILPLFEALGDLLPEITELIITPVRLAFDYYKRLNDAQIKSRKSVADTSSIGLSGDNSGASDNKDISCSSTIGGFGNGVATSLPRGSSSGGGISPQMPRSQSGISVKSRRSIPSQKSNSRTSIEDQSNVPAELHDLPEGSESGGDSETATEVDVAEKTSKFKVDTEGSSNRSKISYSATRKVSREKRPSMIGELCSSGQRLRNSYGSIHGQQNSRNQFGANRAVSLDQYSTTNNNRHFSSEALQQVISDSNVFYNHHEENLDNLEVTTTTHLDQDPNMNVGGVMTNGNPTTITGFQKMPNVKNNSIITSNVLNVNTIASNIAATTTDMNCINITTTTNSISSLTTTSTKNSVNVMSTAQKTQPCIINTTNISSNGNFSSIKILQQQHCCNANTNMACIAHTTKGRMSESEVIPPPKSTWRVRLKQFSEYFNFSFDKSIKRFGSTRSSPCSLRNNNTSLTNTIIHTDKGRSSMLGPYVDPLTGKPISICCTISNNIESPSKRQMQDIKSAISGRHRAYSLDVPCNRTSSRYSSSSGGGGDTSRKSSRYDGAVGSEENSNITLHSSSGTNSDVPTCLPPPIRLGSVDASDTLLIAASGLARALPSPTIRDVTVTQPNASIDLDSAFVLSEAPKI